MNTVPSKVSDKLPLKLESGISDIPDTSEFKIVIQLNLITYCFSKDLYKEGSLTNIISKEEFAKILDNSGLILSNAWKQKKLQDKMDNPWIVRILVKILLSVTIFYCLSIFVAAYFKKITNQIVIVALTSYCIIFLSSIAISLINYFIKLPTYHIFEEFAQEKMNKYLNEVNIQYKDKLEWKFFSKRNYLECNIIHKDQSRKVIDDRSIISEREKLIKNDINNFNSKDLNSIIQN